MLQSCVIVAKLINLRIARQPDQNWAVFFTGSPWFCLRGVGVKWASHQWDITSNLSTESLEQHPFGKENIVDDETSSRRWVDILIPPRDNTDNRARHRDMSVPGAGPGVGISLGWPCCHYPGLCLSPGLLSLSIYSCLTGHGLMTAGGRAPVVTCLQINSVTRWRGWLMGWLWWPALQHYRLSAILSQPGPVRPHLQVATLSRASTCPGLGLTCPLWLAICRKYQVIMANVLFHAWAGGQSSARLQFTILFWKAENCVH